MGRSILDILTAKQICFDGKKSRASILVRAWVSENNLCIGQKKIKDKSNEITAIPALLEEIDIENAVVSIDAIGSQREIAESIIEKKGHYLLALKDNQEELFTDVESGFKACRADSISEEWEYD